MTSVLRQIKILILVLGDTVLLYLVLAAVLAIRYRENFSQHIWSLHFLPFTILFAVWILIFYISGLYDPRVNRNGIEFYTLVLRTLLASAVVSIIYFYIFSNRLFSIRPQIAFLIFLLIFSLVFLLWRRIYNHLVAQSQVFSRSLLAVGDGPDMQDLLGELEQKPYYGYRVIGWIPTSKLQTGSVNFYELIREKKIDTIVTSLELGKYPQAVESFYKTLRLGVRYLDLTTFYEKLTGRVPTSTIGQLWFLENISESEKQLYELIKRILEIIFSLAFATIGLILCPFIVLGIKVSSPGPIFFMQKRIGKQGKIFSAMKFRTMYQGSEDKGPQWTKINDPRVTKFGSFLRKTRLDEIPQFINILRGEMSFIGPRPEQPEFVQERSEKIPYYSERHLIKPGLTGWAQIHFPYGSASIEDSVTKLQYDLYYVKNRSALLDIGIILKTINTIISGQGR